MGSLGIKGGLDKQVLTNESPSVTQSLSLFHSLLVSILSRGYAKSERRRKW